MSNVAKNIEFDKKADLVKLVNGESVAWGETPAQFRRIDDAKTFKRLVRNAQEVSVFVPSADVFVRVVKGSILAAADMLAEEDRFVSTFNGTDLDLLGVTAYFEDEGEATGEAVNF